MKQRNTRDEKEKRVLLQKDIKLFELDAYSKARKKDRWIDFINVFRERERGWGRTEGKCKHYQFKYTMINSITVFT